MVDTWVTSFAAGETKKHYFDFVVGSSPEQGDVLPGRYTAYGGFDNRYAIRENVNIAP